MIIVNSRDEIIFSKEYKLRETTPMRKKDSTTLVVARLIAKGASIDPRRNIPRRQADQKEEES